MKRKQSMHRNVRFGRHTPAIHYCSHCNHLCYLNVTETTLLRFRKKSCQFRCSGHSVLDQRSSPAMKSRRRRQLNANFEFVHSYDYGVLGGIFPHFFSKREHPEGTFTRSIKKLVSMPLKIVGLVIITFNAAV